MRKYVLAAACAAVLLSACAHRGPTYGSVNAGVTLPIGGVYGSGAGGQRVLLYTETPCGRIYPQEQVWCYLRTRTWSDGRPAEITPVRVPMVPTDYRR